ncbi:receptor-type tyrosine-protein phosphatase epsilon-like [Saccostrea echinata]|uniref:receptor-type tyrosine-protein phosphatase epsilon-like n=1 Tax=Saccostrea echinata TaxID=191078 RepID=UPI002A81B61C|nr:receptor-type tyrosine-protein phosphatase epsilon-like [Saccostrea echinata]
MYQCERHGFYRQRNSNMNRKKGVNGSERTCINQQNLKIGDSTVVPRSTLTCDNFKSYDEVPRGCKIEENKEQAKKKSVSAQNYLSNKKPAFQKTTSTVIGSEADNAVDGNQSTCTMTKPIGPNTGHDRVWWYVDLGDVYSVYSINIHFKDMGKENVLRQRGRFAGFSLYLSNSTEKDDGYMCYKDGPELPPLNFTSKLDCIGHTRYVIYYNERLTRVTYPEGYGFHSYTQLCEVVVEGCSRGKYGANCDIYCPANCFGTECNIIHGTCMKCKPGWVGESCQTPCPRGSYGQECKFQCSGHCKDRIPCDHVTGGCAGGCVSGWTGTMCNKICDDGRYGINCTSYCSGHCLNDESCNKETGHCDSGCSDGYIGDLCKNGTSLLISESTSVKALTVGGVLGAITVVTILFVLIALAMRLRNKKYKNTKPVSSERKPMMELDNKLPSREERQVCEDLSIMQTNDFPGVQRIPNNIHETAKRGRPTNKTISTANFHSIISKMSTAENLGFKQEYRDIPKGEFHPCEEGKKPENKVKNRYTTTFPYDHSRVVLKTSKPNEGNYINANYIEDVLGKRSYIATQGPKPKTIPDFWKMIWQENVLVIVCLTNLKEGEKTKCAQYWPEINDKLIGDILVKNLEEKSHANYTIRRFNINKRMEKATRDVVMFHFTRWPDHGVPDPLSLVVFHRHVMRVSAQYPGKYTVVHCSAGIGRTGTYIALDALYREGERNGKVNVPMYVRTMRKDRMNMIQGDDQYKAVYLALCESFNGKSRCLTTESFLRQLQEQSCYTNCGEEAAKSSLSSELQELLSLRKKYEEKDYETGRMNKSANYTYSVLPLDEYLCHLSYSKGRNTYYNAVILQSFTENDSLISAQYPLPDYTEDFLRLVKDFDVNVVVFLCPLKDLKSSSVWVPSKNDHKTAGNFTIKLAASTNSTNFSTRSIVLQHMGISDTKIIVLECKTWKEGKKTMNKSALLDVVKEAKSEKVNHEGKILILSSDGATRCGAFAVVYNALEQLSMDQEVDIFTITRQLQIRRPEFVSVLDEYQLCYDTVAEYIQNDSVYANC